MCLCVYLCILMRLHDTNKCRDQLINHSFIVLLMVKERINTVSTDWLYLMYCWGWWKLSQVVLCEFYCLYSYPLAIQSWQYDTIDDRTDRVTDQLTLQSPCLNETSVILLITRTSQPINKLPPMFTTSEESKQCPDVCGVMYLPAWRRSTLMSGCSSRSRGQTELWTTHSSASQHSGSTAEAGALQIFHCEHKLMIMIQCSTQAKMQKGLPATTHTNLKNMPMA